MGERLLTPSTITAWLDCGHYLTLQHEVEAGVREPARLAVGEMARMLLDKGMAHEQQVLQRYRAEGRSVVEIPGRRRGEPFSRWVDRTASMLDEGHEVLYQVPFMHDGIRGIADFVERVSYDDGTRTYEPVDAKLARQAAKPGHVLQLCFYAEAIRARTGVPPRSLHIELGSGRRESVRHDDVAAYWRRLRGRLRGLVAAPPSQPSVPEPCPHCTFCEFEPVCTQRWRQSDSLIFVAGLRSADRVRLEQRGVSRTAMLADLRADVDGIDPERLGTLVRQASLQMLAREAPPDDPPPFELLDRSTRRDDDSDGGPHQAGPLVGFAALPRPDEGDVFLDFEGHPFWQADVGLFFLFGLIEQQHGTWQYRAFWAHDPQQEAQATTDLIGHLVTRLRLFPEMHVYHYNHTERTSLVRLTQHYGVAERRLERLVSDGVFVDLLPVVTGSLQAGVESYGLKHVERLAGFQRSHDIDRGAGAVVEYEHWMGDGDATRLDRIARYNEDDVRATRALRDWLVQQRPDGTAWRPAVLEPAPDDPELDARIDALHRFDPGTPEHLLGDLLGYWRRERAVVAADCLRLSLAPRPDQMESPSCITGLTFEGMVERTGKNGKPLAAKGAVFSFPEQPIDVDIAAGSTMIMALQQHEWIFCTLSALDRDAGRLQVLWTAKHAERDVLPTSLVHFVSFNEKPKQDALGALADRMLAGEATSAGHAILRRDAPVFEAGCAPDGGVFKGDLESVCAWAPHLQRSYVPVQGPPGTGKTFTGAHVIKTLVQHGRRVGITAMSHQAIDNLVQAVANRFAEDGLPLRAVRKAAGGPVQGVDYVNDNKKCANGDYDVVAGTAWLFASEAMQGRPVDVLVIDEAGQLGLADTLAASVSATNVILLGDPQQLPQVAQAVHPNGSGASALEHLLGDEARTFSPDRGVLLDVSWRMHPDVCRFISSVMYDGRLTSHASCSRQGTVAGTGLRWLRAEHTDCSTESPQEADLVAAAVLRLIGTSWTDQHAVTRPIGAEDVMVVAPYNDHRRLLTATLAAHPATAGVDVGTVDKFQGREAAVVVFSMATSSAEFMPRDADFLFSKNRLNVAVSRARCLAYLVCTEQLLDTRARDVEQMALISALCSFVEHADP
jgi:uncharacterized protein